MSMEERKVPPERQHEIRNEIAKLLCEFFSAEMLGVASSVANNAIEEMDGHVWSAQTDKESES